MALVLVYNFFTTSIVNYTDIGIFGMSQEQIFGMSTTLFYVYLLVQLVLIVALVAYYFTDYLFGDDTTPRSEQRAIAFDEYLKKQAEEKNLAEDSGIWRD
jgi:cytosine/uracil/thiamine/allantoin permease